MRTLMTASLFAGALMLASQPAGAHHAFQAEFDAKKPIKLEGKVTKMEWINPHAWIHLEVTTPEGKTEEWMVEGGSPNIMLRRGFTKQSLQAGAEIIAEGYQAKNGERKANGGSITFKSTGQKLFVGGSNPDDPGNQGK